MSENVMSVEELEEYAKEKGLVVRYPAPNELFIDIDSETARELHESLLGILGNVFGMLLPFDVTPSPSGKPGRYHVVVTLPRDVKDETERLMLQAMLGSDPKRELLGYMHLLDGADPKRCNCLFERALPEAANG